MQKRIAIIGGGVSGLGVAWALNQHPDQFDFRLFEALPQLGVDAATVDMLQDDSPSIQFDISVTACIPTMHHHIQLLLQQHGIKVMGTNFSYSAKYHGGVYAHDFDSII